MPNTKTLYHAPPALTFKTTVETVKLMVHGQGVFLFDAKEACSFTIYGTDESDGLVVSLTQDDFLVSRIKNGDKYVSQTAHGGLTANSGAYYWLSLDSQNMILQAGVGEPRIETLCYRYAFDAGDKLWEANKMFLESLTTIKIHDAVVKPLRLLKNPITNAVPLLIKGMNDLTMDDVAGTTYLPSAALSTAAQSLYNCIAGEKFILNSPDFPDFADAIEYSIRTPGLWCNTRLQQKATEFGKDPQPLETYLRITLGQNNGESPGVPYVMEIWPVGHYSPIHNHSGANAVIRVLHGSIHVKLFPYLCDQEKSVAPFGEKDFTKGDVTWISPSLNQVHQLKNLDGNKDTCITIQCYMYDGTDAVHYDYFDYLGDHNAKQQYEPDSDMDFVQFKQTMKKEWDTRPKCDEGKWNWKSLLFWKK